MQTPSAEQLPEHRTQDPWVAAHWGIRDVVGVVALTALLTTALALLLVPLAGLEGAPRALRGVLLPLPLVLLGLVTIAWVHLRYRAAWRLAGPAPAAQRDLLRGIGWGTAAFLGINIGLGLLIQTFARAFGIELPAPQERVRELVLDPVLLAWLLLTAVIIAPLCEELFFRGMLLQALRRHMTGGWSIGVSALIFAAAHLVAEPTGRAGVLVFVIILPMGLLLGWMFERRGGLAVPVVMHATFNLITTSVLVAGQAGVPAQ